MKPRQINIVEQTEGFDEYVAKYRPIIATGKKKQLLEMAKRGGAKPSWNTPLGSALNTYTSQSANAYDPDFDKKIRKLRPDWFVTQFDLADDKKQQLLEMAKQGDSKPSCNSPLRNVLTHYTRQSSGCYDPDFDKNIRKLRPDWFVPRSDQATEKKNQLLKMAKRDGSRPPQSVSLGSALHTYTSQSSSSYDPNFDKKIRELRPDWFPGLVVVMKKQQLIKMAKQGDVRSHSNTSLGWTLCSYTSRSSGCYDSGFDKKIRKLRPDWFANTATEKKGQLLELAKQDEVKPSWNTPLGIALGHYTRQSSGCYDPDFDKKIRGTRPDWFGGRQKGCGSQ